MDYKVGDIIQWIGSDVVGLCDYEIIDISDRDSGGTKYHLFTVELKDGEFRRVEDGGDLGWHQKDNYIERSDLFRLSKPPQKTGW